ncbi:hypothetical protein CkaCkLH20_00950 [Colletotrichum karsti]|uniref:Uncharacterized protein n=1 Tax=Colletotrichum karsti TaxID=1095194 RepID=A0A9P6LMS4_9PEZI|nr:uncharacterized protein CkaCkLH20_00950 [Colletotrichum karsti]KAF9881804.1 hypothetical protein CkaCkLH20_00950 [Colletotrichum karsti]
MSGVGPPIFPLESVSRAQLQELCEILWHQPKDADATSSQPWGTHSPQQSRKTKLEPYFQFYREMTASYIYDAFPPDEVQALRSHEDLFNIARLIRDKSDVKRADLVKDYFDSRRDDGETLPEDEDRAFNLAVRVMLMVGCSFEGQIGGLLELGTEPSIWRNEQSLQDFVSATFPTRHNPVLDDDDVLPDMKSALRATRLKKVAGLTFEGTDDLRNHLRLNHKTGVVEVFHHTTVLKEYLRASKDQIGQGASSLLPRQLALETIDSLQKVLFPLDKDSQALLLSLVSKQSLDPDCRSLSYPSYRHEHERKVTYQYWGSRLVDLYEELENPKPRDTLGLWLKANSKERHVMLATLVGVMIAIILGILSLVVGIFQAWVAYEAWKHPVKETPEK